MIHFDYGGGQISVSRKFPNPSLRALEAKLSLKSGPHFEDGEKIRGPVNFIHPCNPLKYSNFEKVSVTKSYDKHSQIYNESTGNSRPKLSNLLLSLK